MFMKSIWILVRHLKSGFYDSNLTRKPFQGGYFAEQKLSARIFLKKIMSREKKTIGIGAVADDVKSLCSHQRKVFKPTS